MKILALEFSSSRRSVAIATVSGDLSTGGPVVVHASSSRIGGRETQAFALIHEALEKSGLCSEEVEGLVVGIGPGSYTGIRAAISVAQGWALARPIVLAGIRSSDALCDQVSRMGSMDRFGVVADAQRGDVYYQENLVSGDGWQVTQALSIRPAEEVRKLAEGGVLLFGCDLPDSWVGVRQVFPDAEIVCRLAGRGLSPVTPESLEPVYLREVSFVKAPFPRYS
jgi:tRNA threonylcarbamoyladenosine biosynthesis protein TsaB